MSEVTLDRGEGTTCTIALYGATLTSWKVKGEQLIFVSPNAILDGSKAIRGGIPICFPSFGPWSLGPQHGFARTSVWSQEGQIQENQKGDPSVTLVLTEGDHSSAWPHRFVLKLSVTLSSSSLFLRLQVENKNTEDPFDFTTALHTYFTVPDVTKASIEGLEGLQYIDKTVDGTTKMKEDREKVILTDWTDRVYLNTGTRTIVINRGPGAGILLLTKNSSLSDTVVWNPWAEKAAAMSDLGGCAWPGFLCVEAGQCVQSVQVPSGGKWEAEHGITFQADN